MKFKGTKEKWEVLEGTSLIGVKIGHKTFGIDNINEEAKANALLISKAPEMLEILQSLVSSEMTPLAIRKQAKQLIKEATEF